MRRQPEPDLPYSNQFPVTRKKKAVSWSLLYKGLDIPTARLCPYGVCVAEKNRLVRAGYEKTMFEIVPNKDKY